MPRVRTAKKKRRNYKGVTESSTSNRKMTRASLYTHKMVYENGVLIGREPIEVKNED